MPSEVIALMSAIKNGEEAIHDDIRICKFNQKVTDFETCTFGFFLYYLM